MKELTIVIEVKMGVSDSTTMGQADTIVDDYIEQMRKQFDTTSEIDALEFSLGKRPKRFHGLGE